MFKHEQPLSVFAGAALLLSAIALVTPRLTSGQKPDVPGGPNKPTQNVNVVNTTLPVTGTVAVESPSDSPLLVSDVDTFSRQPFHNEFQIPFIGAPPTIHVPLGKRLVLEYGWIHVSDVVSCSVVFMKIQTLVGGMPVQHIIPISSHRTLETRSLSSAGQQIKLYADPGTDVTVNFTFTGDFCNEIGWMGVSGYFENVPQP